MTGRSVAMQTQQDVLISDKECARALDSESLLHGFSGRRDPNEVRPLLESYVALQQEFSRRSVVFERLADLYDALGDLAGLDTGGQMEKALEGLGDAVTAYAKGIKRQAPSLGEATAGLSTIRGLGVTEAQKARVKEASTRIRARIEAFLRLLEDPRVREQMTGFRALTASYRKAAFVMLWDAGAYDPKSLLDDFGTEVRLVAQKDAGTLVRSNPRLGNALKAVLEGRLERSRFEVVEEGYNASLEALRQLVAEHKRLERGEPLDGSSLHAFLARPSGTAVSPAKAGGDGQ